MFRLAQIGCAAYPNVQEHWAFPQQQAPPGAEWQRMSQDVVGWLTVPWAA